MNWYQEFDRYAWREFREKVIKKHPFCKICHDTKGLTVHHIEDPVGDDRYTRLYNYYDKEIVIVLCKKCHYTCHEEALNGSR